MGIGHSAQPRQRPQPKVVFALVAAVAVLTVTLALAPRTGIAQAVPSENWDMKVWDPAAGVWTAGAPSGYTEGEVIPIAVEIDAPSSADAQDGYWSGFVCLRYFIDDEYFFADFDEWDTTYSPPILPDQVDAPTQFVSDGPMTMATASATTLEILSLQLPTEASGFNPGAVICATVRYSFEELGQVWLLFGGRLAQPGETVPYPPDVHAPALPTDGVVVDGPAGTSHFHIHAFPGGGSHTITLAGVGVAAAEPITLAKTWIGGEFGDEVGLSLGARGRPLAVGTSAVGGTHPVVEFDYAHSDSGSEFILVAEEFRDQATFDSYNVTVNCDDVDHTNALRQDGLSWVLSLEGSEDLEGAECEFVNAAKPPPALTVTKGWAGPEIETDLTSLEVMFDTVHASSGWIHEGEITAEPDPGTAVTIRELFHEDNQGIYDTNITCTDLQGNVIVNVDNTSAEYDASEDAVECVVTNSRAMRR